MTDNWELALSKASGEYVTIIGDDDGLLPYALDKMNRLIEELELKILRWQRVYYSWPDLAKEEYANKLDIPLKGENRILDSKIVIPLVANYKMDYTILPMIYNSFIHRDFIIQLCKKTSRVFRSSIPDVYSGFAFAYLAKKYASISHPMSINGGSSKSNGVATMMENDNPIKFEFNHLNKKAGFTWNPKVPKLMLMPAIIAESFEQAKETLFYDDPNLVLDRKNLVENCVKSMDMSNEENLKKNLSIIGESLRDDKDLQAWFKNKFLSMDLKPKMHDALTKWECGFYNDTLTLNAADFEVYDVYSVSKLCEKIIGNKKIKFDNNENRLILLLKILKEKLRLTRITGLQ